MKINWKVVWYILAFIAISFFSLNWIWWRFLTSDEGLNPLLILFIRFLWWIIILSLFIPFFSKKNDFKKLFKWENKLHKSKTFWLSSIFFFFTILFFIFWMKFSSASNVVLIQSLAPILVAILTLYLNPEFSKKYNYRKIFFISVIASIWSSLLVSDNSLNNRADNSLKIVWDLLAFFSMIFFAFFSYYYVELKKEYNKSNWLIVTLAFLFVWLILSLPSIFFSYKDLLNVSELWYYFMAIISFWSTWLAYLAWFSAWKHLSALTMVVIFNIVWLKTIITEYLFYWSIENEITYKLYIWATLIIWSIYYMSYLNSKK